MPNQNNNIKKGFKYADKQVENISADTAKELLTHYKNTLKQVKYQLTYYLEKPSQRRLDSLRIQIENEIKKLQDIAYKNIYKNIADVYKKGYYNDAYAFESSLFVDLGFSQLDPKVIENVVTNKYNLIKWPDSLQDSIAVYRRQLITELSNGISLGKGYRDIASQLTEKSRIGYSKALKIIRTEAHRAQNQARLDAIKKAEEAAEKLGYKGSKVWNSTLDGRTRTDHRKLDGKKADKEGYFMLAGVRVTAPGLSGIASQDINCRCGVIYVFNEFPPENRRTGDGEVIPYQNFDEWAKKKGV